MKGIKLLVVINVIVVALFAFILGCSNPLGSDNDQNVEESDTVSIKGRVSDDSEASASLSTTKSIKSDNSELIVRVYHAPSLQGLSGVDKNQYSKAINDPQDHPVENGSFEFNVEDGDSFVAILMESLDEDRVNALGVIGIGTGSDEYWHAVDTSLIDGYEIDLGSIDLESDIDFTLATENDVYNIGSDVSDQLEKVKSLARFDNAVKVLANMANSNTIALPTFRFLSSETFKELAGGDAGGIGESDPSNYDLMGYRFVCVDLDTSGITEFELYPPQGESIPVIWNGESTEEKINEDNPLYAKPRDPDEDYYYYRFFTDDTFEDDKALAGFYLLGDNPPTGAWSARENQSDEFAKLYFGMYPPITEEAHLQLPIPQMSVETDEEGYLTHINIQWVIWDGTDYIEIAPDVVEPFLAWGGIDMQGHYEGERVNSGHWLRSNSVWETEFTIEPEGYDRDGNMVVEDKKWYLPGAAGTDPEEGIEVDLIRPAYDFFGYNVELFHQEVD